MRGLVQGSSRWYGVGLVALLATAGCAPSVAPAGVDVVVRRPPPARLEVRGRQPGPGYVWINGHQAYQGGDYVWVSGRWEAPPQPTYRRWEAGHWQHSRSGWYWVEGHWR